MCSPKGVGLCPEPDQEEPQFIKRDTYVQPRSRRELKRRKLGKTFYVDMHDEARLAVEQTIGGALTEEKKEVFLKHLEAKWAKVDIYDSILWKLRNPRASALHKLDARAPAPPRLSWRRQTGSHAGNRSPGQDSGQFPPQ